jgi:DnaA family protein
LSLIPQQIPLQFQPRRQDRFETFVAGENQPLLDLLASLPQDSRQSIFIHGDGGSGKTHMLNALCHQAQQQGHSAIYLPLARLDDTVASQLHGLENTAIVCIDDFDNACGRVIWEEALFHLFNRVLEKQGTMLIAARAAPATLPVRLADLSSRLTWGQVQRLHSLNEAGRRQVLKNYARQQGFEVPPNVLNYFFSRSRRNLKELLSAMDLLGQTAFAQKRAITVPLAREVLLQYWSSAAERRPASQD